jgi:hypothetical protein
MPITYVVDPILQRMTPHADGLITYQDITRHLDDEERERALGLPELFDACGATTDITADQVRRLVQRAARTARQAPLGPTAIVATNDTVFGMARMYSILMEPVAAPVGVFRDRDAAIRWLEGLQRPPI